MNELKRILDDPEASPALRSLFESASVDQPTQAQLAGLSSKLELPATGGGALSIAKVLLTTTSILLLGTAIYIYSGKDSMKRGNPDPPQVTPSQPALASQIPDETPMETPEVAEEVAGEVAEEVAVLARPARSAGSKGKSRKPGSDSTAEVEPEPVPSELQLIAQARRALRQHQPEAVLALLEQHKTLIPAPKMAEEANVLHIRVLALEGQPEAARRLFTAFSQRYPRSSHLSSLQALLSP